MLICEKWNQTFGVKDKLTSHIENEHTTIENLYSCDACDFNSLFFFTDIDDNSLCK